jgi:hypothetical protein
MSRMLVRPPAARVHLLPQQGPLTASAPARNEGFAPADDKLTPARDVGRQTFGATDATKNYGPSGFTQPPMTWTWQDRVDVPPVSEQPKLIFVSGAQPLVRWGLMRRFSRTYMTASPRFQGRWAYVGFIQRHFTDRARMTGVATRQGTTYVVPRVGTGPGTRAIRLGG